MERISFQGRNLATAHRVWQKMLQDDVTIFLGMAGALSAGGLRMIVAHLIANRYVDCLVSTGAILYHDLHETRGQHGVTRVSDLAKQLDVSPGTVSSVLKKLEQMHLVQHERYGLISLTPDGTDVAECVIRRYETVRALLRTV